MMMLSEMVHDSRSLIVEGSPVQFAVMAPVGSHRRVVLRSGGDVLDLIGLDNTAFRLGDRPAMRAIVLPFTGSTEIRLSQYIVRSGSFYDVHSSDEERSSYLSFAWRGLASSSDIEDVSKLFERVSIDFGASLKRWNAEDVEWHIAPMIALCQQATEREVRRIGRQTWMWAIATLTYLILILVALWRALPLAL